MVSHGRRQVEIKEKDDDDDEEAMDVDDILNMDPIGFLLSMYIAEMLNAFRKSKTACL